MVSKCTESAFKLLGIITPACEMKFTGLQTVKALLFIHPRQQRSAYIIVNSGSVHNSFNLSSQKVMICSHAVIELVQERAKKMTGALFLI